MSNKMDKEKGNQTIYFKNKPRIICGYSIAGPKEGKGPLGKDFDYILDNDTYTEKTFEMAERKMVEEAVIGVIKKAGLKKEDIDMMLSGDLLNQIISSSYAARAFDMTYLGLFGACSTMAESLAIGSLIVDGGHFKNVICTTVSHFATAERQFRFPLELGNQRPPTSQWTVTGAGASILSSSGRGPYIECATFGKVMDYGITDVNNMGAAMAPAAMNTLTAHFKDTNTTPKDYDLILTGDLGKFGSEVLKELMLDEGYNIEPVHDDCGKMIFDQRQNTMMGGSGCGCSACVLNSVILNRINSGAYKKILFMATGALLSTTSTQQGESIPGVAHAIVIVKDEGETNSEKVEK